MIAKDQTHLAAFVLLDSAGTELSGLGNSFSVFVSKAGGAFNAGVGAKAEIGNGWYTYLIPASETDELGPLTIYITAVGAIQQNLYFDVGSASIYAIEFPYTVLNSVTGSPIPNTIVWFTTDINGLFVIWTGITDTFGIARDTNGNLPFLDPGTYYVWCKKVGYIFANPDTEVVT